MESTWQSAVAESRERTQVNERIVETMSENILNFLNSWGKNMKQILKNRSGYCSVFIFHSAKYCLSMNIYARACGIVADYC
jgi:hypothetical protein